MRTSARLVSAVSLLILSLAWSSCATTGYLGQLRHVVLFKFKDTATPEQIATVEAAFRSLPAKIPEITGFEWGTDVSVENKADGFTHCFLVTFRDADGRAIYLPHPAHKEFVGIVGPLLDKVLVVDYVAAN